MITWVPLAGRLVEFIATKLLGNKLDATLDDKKGACRAFLELHDALFEVEQLTNKFIHMLERVAREHKPRLYGAWLRGLQVEVAGCTSRFIAAADHVSRVLEVLDPALFLTFGQMRKSRTGLVAAVSRVFSGQVVRFEVQWQQSEPPDRLLGISYTSPPTSVMNLDLEALYQSVRGMEVPRGMFGGGIDMLARNLPEENAVEVLVPDDVSGIARLAARCREHVQPVAAARAKLHEFVAAEFSIDDLLYVGSGTSARVTGWPPRL